MKLSVIGTGYVGLVSGTCFSDLGNTVICVDNDPDKLKVLKSGKSPFYEPGLDEKLTKNIKAGRLLFTENLVDAVTKTDMTFIAVGTPANEDGGADLSAVFKVAESIIQIIKTSPKSEEKAPFILVTKSTVPVGTGEKIQVLIKEAGLSEKEIAVASNPEFLREGSALYDFFRPDRVVIGSDNDVVSSRIARLYEPLHRIDTPIVKTTLKTSELSKYASNAFLATKISFINEMANLCEKVGADVQKVAKIMGQDGRIGKYFLHSGPGYGGACFPKDTKALIKIAEEVGYDYKIVKATEDVNAFQKQTSITKLKALMKNEIKGKTIGVLGLAFKPNTDDIREAPALPLIDYLLSEGCTVQLFDPEAMDNGKMRYHQIKFMTNSYDVAAGADALVVMTEWHLFRELDLDRVRSSMTQPILLDMRNIYDPKALKEKGFIFQSVGR